MPIAEVPLVEAKTSDGAGSAMIGRGGLGAGFQRCKPVGLCELLGGCLRRSEIVYNCLKNLGKMIPKLLCAELDSIGCLRLGECHRVFQDFPRIPFDKISQAHRQTRP